ncbi:SUR7 protein [Hypoxylon argillaceum]|nr:SUR7 protein [Hypoxylon argillaceum]KAI1150489.1 SUR7 protein [Nemania diffusa]
MGVGRYFCVALPFILTVASIIAALIVGLTGVTSNNLYLFRIDVTNLSIDATQIQNLVENATSLLSRSEVEAIVNRSPVEWHDASLLSAKESSTDVTDAITNALSGTNITASDIGLANVYDFTLWGLCVTPEDGKRNCTKAEFDWATHELDLDWVQQLINATGLDITIPDSLNDGLNSYKTITRWTEIVFIIAIVALGLELVVGLFTACSRAISCVTWLISGFATAAIIATAILLTVTGATVIGVVLGVSKQYGVKANLNTSFLAVLWLSVAFALGAGLFWLFSICCCKPERRPYGKASRHSDGEKLIPNSSYAPIGENHSAGYNGYNYAAPQRGGARSDLAYEPYSHSRV